jgi:hypothetical protein
MTPRETSLGSVPPASIRDQIRAEVLSWSGVTEQPHRFGGVEFALGRRELGHLHGQRTADLPFPRAVRDELIATGRARPHHFLPDSGWVTYDIHSEADVPGSIALFRLTYERAAAAQHENAERVKGHRPTPSWGR